MAESRGNFSSCCRLCLSENPEGMKSIFGEGREDRTLQQKILTSLSVEITIEDKLSTMVCPPCIEKINTWQSYQKTCSDNQNKLQQWLQQTPSSSEMSLENIQIKEEPVEIVRSKTPEILAVNGGFQFQDELDAPPTLSPQNNGEVEVPTPDSNVGSLESDSHKCSECGKMFSSSGNRRKHERMIHGKKTDSATESDVGSSSQDDQSQTSIDSQPLEEPPNQDPPNEEGKILFAAGLKLLQRNGTPPISHETLSKIEYSYTEKCKAMANMYRTLKCACHNVSHPNLKGLLSHLRALRIWFPVFTCYHCMITFTDRSASTKHYLKCPKTNLETLVKLSNLKKRSEVKTRLYQIYQCTDCKFMYSFHEDFCTHVDEEHSEIELPHTCTCGRVFTTLEDYKDHAYISCLVQFYCDICFVTVKTLDEFQKHASELHDNSEGFILLQDDNYRQRRSMPSPTTSPKTRGVKREYTDESNIISGKRRGSYKPPIIEPELEEEKEAKVLNPYVVKRIQGTACPICLKEYSSNNNMWRHYKTHIQDIKFQEAEKEEDDALYCCPDCGGMFNTSEWEQHKVMHKTKSCGECGKIFQFQSELDQHRSVHLNLKVYRDSKTQSYKSTSVTPDNIMVMCEICDTMFPTKELLKAHKLTHDTMPVLENNVDSDEGKDNKYHCKLCNKPYAAYGGLWSHNKKEHPENATPRIKEYPKRCKVCDRVFFTGSSYYSHKQMHERNNQLKKQQEEDPEGNDTEDESYHTCKRCFKVFSTKSNLKNHMRSHGMAGTKKQTKKVWCDICHAGFETAEVLEKHKSEVHDEEMPVLSDGNEDIKAFVFTCDICVQTFTSRNALKKHKEKHAREVKPFRSKPPVGAVCKHCKVSFDSPQLLFAHMREEHMEAPKQKPKDKQKVHSCKLCKKTYTSAFALHAHVGWHKRGKATTVPPDAEQPISIKQEPVEEPPKFKCNTCNTFHPNDTALQIHILEKHRNVNAIVLHSRCSSCNLDFASQDEYEQHRKFHAMVEKQAKKSFCCSHCPAAFSRIDNLKTHVRQFHKEFLPRQEFKCPQCDRNFDKQTSLSIHLKVHDKQKMVVASSSKHLYSCSICNMGFDLPKDLRTHTIQAHPF